MEIDADKLLMNAVRDGIREGIKSKMTQTYQNPFDDLVKDALAKAKPEIESLIGEAISGCVADATFRAGIVESLRGTIAKQLVQKFGGEIERQVNQLKSDPATRARITLAIEEIVKSKA